MAMRKNPRQAAAMVVAGIAAIGPVAAQTIIAVDGSMSRAGRVQSGAHAHAVRQNTTDGYYWGRARA
jgi:hypothetical protein